MDERPLAPLAHPHAHRLHNPPAGTGPVAGLLVYVEAGQTVGAVVAVPAGGPLWGDQRAAGLAGEGLPAGLAAVVRGGLGGGGRAPETGGVQPECAVRPLGERDGSGGAEGGLHPGQTLDQGGLAAPRAAQHGHGFSAQGGEKPGGRLQGGAPGQAVQLRAERLQPAGQGVSLLRGQPVPVADKEPGGQARRPGGLQCPLREGEGAKQGGGRAHGQHKIRVGGQKGIPGAAAAGAAQGAGPGEDARQTVLAAAQDLRLGPVAHGQAIFLPEQPARQQAGEGAARVEHDGLSVHDARHADGEKVGLVHGYLASLSRPL